MTKDEQDCSNTIAKLRSDLARERQYRDDWQRMTKDLLRIIAGQTEDIQQMSDELLALRTIVDRETPIGAFDLATTWRAEKSLLMAEITELRRQLAACEGRAPWLNEA